MASNMKANETAASRYNMDEKSYEATNPVRIDRVATLARERRQEVQEEVHEEQEQLIANDGAMADVANNQAHLFHRSTSSHS